MYGKYIISKPCKKDCGVEAKSNWLHIIVNQIWEYCKSNKNSPGAKTNTDLDNLNLLVAGNVENVRDDCELADVVESTVMNADFTAYLMKDKKQ